MSDEKLIDGIRLTADAHEAGQLSALRDVGELLEQLTKAVRDKIEAIESHRGDDEAQLP
jgi:hypothetical protein